MSFGAGAHLVLQDPEDLDKGGMKVWRQERADVHLVEV